MRGKLKLFLALCAIGTAFVTSASAQTGGHFTIDVPKAKIKTTESPTHRLEFTFPGLTPILCEERTFPGENIPQTFVDIAITGGAPKCATTGGNPKELEIQFHGCGLKFKIGQKAGQHNTTDIYCPPGEGPIEVIHPNCKVKVPAQNGFNGVTYTNVPEEGKHALTLQLTLAAGPEVTAHFEEGICIFLGTNHAMVVTGSLTVRAYKEDGTTRANITATGSGG